MTKLTDCPECAGIGSIEGGKACPKCKGKGEVPADDPGGSGPGADGPGGNPGT
jgi:RecJ-like exonuclease